MMNRPLSAPVRRALVPLAFATLLGAGMAIAALAGGQNGGLAIYRGDSGQATGIKLSSWGSGTAEAEKRLFYSGSESVRITTHGFYQGVRLQFAKPVDLTPFLTTKTAYLQFILRIPSTNTNGTYPGMGMGSSGIPGVPGMSGMSGPPGGFSSYTGGRGGPGAGRTSTKAQKARALENVRVVLVTEADKQLEALLPVEYARDENQWKILSIPVTAITDLKSDDAQLKEIRIFGDTPTTVYLGAIRVAVDSTPIRVDREEAKVIPRNVKDQFIASATGGSGPLKYSWDFDAADGDDQEDATGRTVQHAFSKSGDYVVTLTVSDPYGVKEPVKTKLKVHVTL